MDVKNYLLLLYQNFPNQLLRANGMATTVL